MPQLHMWRYLQPGGEGGAQPAVVLKTRRSLRAVHFAPHGMPLLLTAEVQPTSVRSQDRSCCQNHRLCTIASPLYISS